MMKDVGQRKGGRRGREREVREAREFEQRVIEIARVTRVVKGGKRMRFRACVVIGDQRGRLGMAIAKGPDVSIAVTKATTLAKKQLIMVPLVEGTIPHEFRIRKFAAEILIKPARPGSGVIAGGALRPVFEVAGVTSVVAKMLGSNNKINNVKALILALSLMKPARRKAQKKAVKPEPTPEAAH